MKAMELNHISLEHGSALFRRPLGSWVETDGHQAEGYITIFPRCKACET